MRSRHLKSIRTRFLLILSVVSVVALSSSLLLRELMVSDFKEYLEGEVEDRIYWVTASLEGSYERYSGWEMQRIVEEVIWALMLGFEVRLSDADGRLITDTESSVNILSPLLKKRVLDVIDMKDAERSGQFVSHRLMLNGRDIGRLDARFIGLRKEKLFISRSNRFLLVSLVGVGGLAILLSIVFSRRLTRPIRGLTDAVTAVAGGDLRKRVLPGEEDELGRLSAAFNSMAHALELQETLRRKLTSNIAHELRTPISAVRGELEGMMDGLIPADREHIQSLYDEIERLKEIIEGLEDLAQAEASVLTLRKQSLDICPFLKNIVARYGKVFQDKDVELGLECAGGVMADADPARLSQIVINLLSNALKATPPGGKVGVVVEKSASSVSITVKDTGTGIGAEDLPYIFERFYKVVNGGLGLGLTIVKELVEAHGGTVSAESEQGRGSTFRITLPV